MQEASVSWTRFANKIYITANWGRLQDIARLRNVLLLSSTSLQENTLDKHLVMLHVDIVGWPKKGLDFGFWNSVECEGLKTDKESIEI